MIGAILILFGALKIMNHVEGRYVANTEFRSTGTLTPLNRVRYFALPRGKKNGEIKSHQLTDADRVYLQALHQVLRQCKFEKMRKQEGREFFVRVESLMESYRK